MILISKYATCRSVMRRCNVAYVRRASACVKNTPIELCMTPHAMMASPLLTLCVDTNNPSHMMAHNAHTAAPPSMTLSIKSSWWHTSIWYRQVLATAPKPKMAMGYGRPAQGRVTSIIYGKDLTTTLLSCRTDLFRTKTGTQPFPSTTTHIKYTLLQLARAAC